MPGRPSKQEELKKTQTKPNNNKKKKKAIANIPHPELGLMKLTDTSPWQLSHQCCSEGHKEGESSVPALWGIFDGATPGVY